MAKIKITWQDVGEWMTGLPFVGGFFSNLVSKDKANQIISASEQKTILNKAITKAQSMGQNALDKVTAALSRLDFVRTSPSLDKVVHAKRKQFEEKQAKLRNDIEELNIINTKAQSEIDREVDDINKSTPEKETNMKEIIKNAEQDIAKVEKRI